MVPLNIGNPDVVKNDLRKNWAGVWAKGSFDLSDPRVVESGVTFVDNARLEKYMSFPSSMEELLRLIQKYENVGASQLIFQTGASPNLIKIVAENILQVLR